MPPARVTARLEDVLAAAGELAALAQTAQVVTHDDERPAAQEEAPGWGFSLSLPYVPGRLVIEVSGPAVDSGQLTGGDTTPGGLTLVPGMAGTGQDRTEEVAGA